MNVFISCPMSGLTDKEVTSTFDRIIETIRTQFDISDDAKFTIANWDPALNAQNLSSLSYLGRAITKLDKCDMIVFVKGFTNARGCLSEYSVLNNYCDGWDKDPTKPNVYFEQADGTLKEAKDRYERHRCFMLDHMSFEQPYKDILKKYDHQYKNGLPNIKNTEYVDLPQAKDHFTRISISK